MKVIVNEYQYLLIEALLLERGERPEYGGDNLLNNIHVDTVLSVIIGDPEDFESAGNFKVVRKNGAKLSLLNLKDNKTYIFDISQFDDGVIKTGGKTYPVYIITIQQKGQDLHFSPRIYEPDPEEESMDDESILKIQQIIRKLTDAREGDVLKIAKFEFFIDEISGKDMSLDIISDVPEQFKALQDPELKFSILIENIVLRNDDKFNMIFTASGDRTITLKNISDISVTKASDVEGERKKEREKDDEAKREKEREKIKADKEKIKADKEEQSRKERIKDRALELMKSNPILRDALKSGIKADEILRKIYRRAGVEDEGGEWMKKFGNRNKVSFRLLSESFSLEGRKSTPTFKHGQVYDNNRVFSKEGGKVSIKGADNAGNAFKLILTSETDTEDIYSGEIYVRDYFGDKVSQDVEVEIIEYYV